MEVQPFTNAVSMFGRQLISSTCIVMLTIIIVHNQSVDVILIYRYIIDSIGYHKYAVLGLIWVDILFNDLSHLNK